MSDCPAFSFDQFGGTDAESLKEFICAWPGLSLGKVMLLFQWVDAALAALAEMPLPQRPGDDLMQRLHAKLRHAAWAQHPATARSAAVIRFTRTPPQPLVDFI